ncbi:MAG: hypothetical protein ACOCN9_08260 [Prevotella sp.]
MKIEKDIRVEMVRMEGDVAPFVQVDYITLPRTQKAEKETKRIEVA